MSNERGWETGLCLPAPPRSTDEVGRALHDIEEALARATVAVRSAQDVDWVSSAAESYRLLLAEQLQALTRLTGGLVGARAAVLHHVVSADGAQLARASEAVTGLGIPVCGD